MLTPNELKRYNRHIIMPEVTIKGQEKLQVAKVLVIGAGGLGCPILQYLTAAGVGTIGVIDNDKIELSNLQRQILFRSSDIGKSKARVAAESMGHLNPSTAFSIYEERLTHINALSIFKRYDIVVDGTDNFETRYLINDTCVTLNKPFVFGSISKFDGQISVFNYQNGPTYRCLFPESPLEMPTCSQIGVLGVLPGIIGSYQANEVLKMVLEIGEVLKGKLLTINTLNNEQNIILFKKVKGNDAVSILPDYSAYKTITCNLNAIEKISVDELAEIIHDVYLLDVREEKEYQICHLPNAQLIPLATLEESISRIPRDKKIVIYCQYGTRSITALKILADNYGYNNLSSLDGGINEWAIEIDNSLEQY